MPEMTEAYDWSGRTLVDIHGEKIGEIDGVYFSRETNQAEWALVDLGFFGTRQAFVPVDSARPSGESVQVQIEKRKVAEAPAIDAPRDLSPEQEDLLRRHYGRAAPTGDGTMTRSEEELQIKTLRRPHTRVRLRKYVITEMVTRTLPVRREEVRLEREPISGAEAVTVPVEDAADEVHEVVLHEEQLVIEKRIVPVERVRLRKETITEQQIVSDELRKEQVETSTGGG